ncbi:MAG: ABC transporter permease, partial [Saprospiraceae bacterium]|nr:ABC transporter permease [Saprospiraceae bacterium]
KVLGASVFQITAMLSREFLKLVLLSLFIALPLGWYLMDRWLEDFAYRVNVPWWAFVLAGSLALTLAIFTVSFQSIKAALTDPVKSLKRE